jgi:repressor LexA
MTAPNTRRARVREFIAEYLSQHGFAPSVREIGGAIGIKSPSAVLYHLRALEKAGELRRVPYRSRAITLLPLHPGKRPHRK